MIIEIKKYLYKCDNCHDKIINESNLPELPGSWRKIGNSHYCVNCLEICKKCKGNFLSIAISGSMRKCEYCDDGKVLRT